MSSVKHIEQQNINHGQSKIVRDYSSNTKGHFVASETVYKNGSVESHTDLGTNNMYNTNRNTNIKGDSINDTKGSSSNIVGGLSEVVTGSNYHITGTEESFRMGYQKLADDAQRKLIAARSQPDSVPNYDSATVSDNLYSIGKNILKNVMMPKAKEIKNKMSESKGAVSGATKGGIMYDLTTELKKLVTFSSCISGSTSSQAVKIESNTKQEKAEANFRAKKKAYDKLSDNQKKVFEAGIGKTLFPNTNGKIPNRFSAEDIMRMFIPPSTSNLTSKQLFDSEKYKEIAGDVAKKDGGTIDIERKI